jgi:hypothetical protein
MREITGRFSTIILIAMFFYFKERDKEPSVRFME